MDEELRRVQELVGKARTEIREKCKPCAVVTIGKAIGLLQVLRSRVEGDDGTK